MIVMPTSLNPDEAANAAIRDYLRSLPDHRPVTAEQRAEYQRLLAVWLAAVGGVVLAA